MDVIITVALGVAGFLGAFILYIALRKDEE